MSASTPIRVVAAVVRRYGRVLVCQRPDHKRHGGLWEFPGGKIEPGESVLDAARRELAEELDATVLAMGELEFAVDDPGSHFRIEFYSMDIAGELRCREHKAFAWVTPEQLLTLPLAPSDRAFALHVGADPTGGPTAAVG